jgi:hypothetical protein
MSTRTITGNLAIDPEVVQAGSTNITKLRVIENTGDYRNGTWQTHPDATTHFVEAKFELGENTAGEDRSGWAILSSSSAANTPKAGETPMPDNTDASSKPTRSESTSTGQQRTSKRIGATRNWLRRNK